MAIYRIASCAIALAVCAIAQTNPDDHTKIAAVSKLFLRDSAELPMDVAVTTVVTDAKGKEKRRAQSTVHFLFHGYNLKTERFSFSARSGWFSTRALHDSMIGDWAVFQAIGMLAPARDHVQLDVRTDPAGPGFAIHGANIGCHEFVMDEHWLIPRKSCPEVSLHSAVDEKGGATLDRFTMEVGPLPVPAKIGYLGDVQVNKLHIEGEIQKTYLPNDSSPFLIPRKVVTTFTTDTGSIVITNEYRAAPGRKQ